MSPTGTLPAIREVHAYGYDPASNSLIVFGFGGNGISYNDTWTLSFANDIGGTPAWTNIIPNGEPGSPPLPFVGGDPGVYDPVTRRLMLEKSQDSGQGQASVVPWVLEIKNQIIAFDPPDSRFTLPTGINPKGEIAGFYQDTSYVLHGFLRAADGKITAFDPPPAGKMDVAGINPRGEITGYSAGHGFLRAADGTFTTFDALGCSGNTFPQSINPEGEITGSCGEIGPIHGFVRGADGTIIIFDPPDALATSPESINSRGEITGFYQSTNLTHHAFLRDKDGTITPFDAGSADTYPYSINPKGEITGYHGGHGFLRRVDGTFIMFDPPGSADTYPYSINPKGEITGYYNDASGRVHGFVRERDGTFATFDAGPNGTYPASINSRGEITGYYLDASGNEHGFLRKPDRRAGSEKELDDEDGEGSENPE
jgi:hypothetical protein